MMSSFTTLKKNSRFKSACPSSGPVTFCEGGPGHVHIRSPRCLTRGFLHQPCARIYSRIASTCPSSGPATSCEGSRPRLRTQSGHVHARSFRCTNLCNFLSASVEIFAAAVRLYSAATLWVFTGGTSGSVGTKHFLGPHCLWVFTFRQDASAAASTDGAQPFLTCTSGPFRWCHATSHFRWSFLMAFRISSCFH